MEDVKLMEIRVSYEKALEIAANALALNTLILNGKQRETERMLIEAIMDQVTDLANEKITNEEFTNHIIDIGILNQLANSEEITDMAKKLGLDD
ncbi:hypothetical protein BCEN4_740175 [Burkholderia cenocepacia]|uniref:hypothetical protein n=1 Tax=Burkholderia cenocepacia TaxID=95486 RepID=UPI00192BA652|nr:hypothetical protein [Burkholderia cenocepacia]CAD9228078.1 hypothetical protein BCEN4_740175 [Burkholderia cenocepacia]